MKAILITILVVILLIFGYNRYTDYKRYHPKHTDYEISDQIDTDYYDQEAVYAYYEAVTKMNNFVTMQWTANGIDVRYPEEEDAHTQLAVEEYSRLRAQVKYHESKLLQAKKERQQEDSKVVDAQSLIQKRLRNLFKSTVNNTLRQGDKGALVYEVQKLLVKKGYEIPLDGVFRTITYEALKTYEASKGLFPDGQLDALTLEYLIE